MKKGELLYEGKAKKIYQIPGVEDRVWVEYKDSLTAFNAQKKGNFENKGQVNREISSLIFRYLQSKGISSHWVSDVNDHEMIVEKLKIIPLEVVVRNTLAGSTAKKMGIEEGRKLPRALVEFYFKDDNLADPFMSDDQILILQIASEEDLRSLKAAALKINQELVAMWGQAGLDLIDFKVEFGKNSKGQILLADEISPDCSRLWDLKTGEKMDKDRFRRDLGQVKESYQEVLKRLREVVHVK